jgi:ketosteroid isomerase-like protein
MNINRRHLAGSAIAVGLALALAGPASAAKSDEVQVEKNTELHRDALAAADAKALDKLCAPELSYSHSDAHVEDKATFIANATNGKSKWLSLSYEDIKVRVVGSAAIVRFRFVGENQSGDKKNQVNLAILMIWQKQSGQWKLLARASTKL